MATILPSSFEGHFVRLRPVARRDYPVIFAQRISPEFLELDHRAVAIPEFERWEAQELADMLRSGPVMVVEDKDGTYLGLVRACNIEPRDRRALLDLRLNMGQEEQTMEALLATLDFLITYVNLRKIYVEAACPGEPLLQWLDRLGFVEEARLTEYVWRGTGFCDLVYYGLDSGTWATRRQHLEQSLFLSVALNQADQNHGSSTS